MNSVFFLGQLVGLPTLKSILTKFGLSNKLQVNSTKLYKKLTINKIRLIFEHVFENQVIDLLQNMASKDSSIWSKKRVTAILDDSIFRQWLSDSGRENEEYGSFFSGQYKSVVFGFKVVCFGLYIEDIFYPLYFDFVKKKKKKKEQAKLSTKKVKTKKSKNTKAKNESIEVAKRLLTRWGQLKTKLAKNKVIIPSIHFSCDNGYNNISLSDMCNKKTINLIYISVPRKNNIFLIDNEKMKLSECIESIFLVKEKEHKEREKCLKECEKTPFSLRIKGVYKCQNRTVTLLFFRLNGSNNVSVIYTPNETIFAKTLRRHWFSRTYIEQFFKTLKHVLKISEARTNNKEKFEIKLLRFTFLAIEVQKIIQFIRRKYSLFKKKGFVFLQRILCSEQEILDLLQSELSVKV